MDIERDEIKMEFEIGEKDSRKIYKKELEHFSIKNSGNWKLAKRLQNKKRR